MSKMFWLGALAVLLSGCGTCKGEYTSIYGCNYTGPVGDPGPYSGGGGGGYSIVVPTGGWLVIYD